MFTWLLSNIYPGAYIPSWQTINYNIYVPNSLIISRHFFENYTLIFTFNNRNNKTHHEVARAMVIAFQTMFSNIETTSGIFKCLLRFYGHKRSKIIRNSQRRAVGKASTLCQFPDSVDQHNKRKRQLLLLRLRWSESKHGRRSWYRRRKHMCAIGIIEN